MMLEKKKEKVKVFDTETNQNFELELDGDQVVSFKSFLAKHSSKTSEG